MKFAYLKDAVSVWDKIKIIGKTIVRDGKQYHLVGMTLRGREAKLYVLEPCHEEENCPNGFPKPRRARNQRQSLKMERRTREYFLSVSAVTFGTEKWDVQSASGGALAYMSENYELLGLVFDFLREGWRIPDWLAETDWQELQLVTLTFQGEKDCLPDGEICITHRKEAIPHWIEKPLTLVVGKKKRVLFIREDGRMVYCYINRVFLMDVWKETEDGFQDTRYKEKFSAEQLEEVKKTLYAALEQNCPKGMCYLCVEYECSEDLQLQFYSRGFLSSKIETHSNTASFVMMSTKPEKEKGIHGLPLRACVLQTPLAPETEKVKAELFLYYETRPEWSEEL